MTATTLDLNANSKAEPTLAVAAGRNLMAAGAVFGIANLSQWAILSGVVPVHPAFLSLIWPVAVTLFIVALRRLRNIGGAAAIRAVGWSRAAILLQLAAALALAGASAMTGNWSLMMWMSPIGLGFYAIAWLIAAMRGGALWMGAVGLAAAAAAGGIALLVGTPAQYLAYAAGLFAFALLPGGALAFGRAR